MGKGKINASYCREISDGGKRGTTWIQGRSVKNEVRSHILCSPAVSVPTDHVVFTSLLIDIFLFVLDQMFYQNIVSRA